MTKKVNRLYNISHADLIEHAKTTNGNLNEYLSSFTDFDSTINETLTDNINLLIEQAENNLSDNVIADRQVQLTDIVKEKMKECREQYQLLSYFIKKAFPESASIRNEFGENDYGNARASQSKMILFMQELHAVAVKYQSELLATGSKQDYIDKVLVLHNELNQANYNQELYKGKRPVLTEERVSILNDLWEVLSLLSQAARIIFANDFARMKLFLLPNKSKSHKDDMQHIKAGETVATIKEGIDEETYIKIENTGNIDLSFYVSEEQAEEIPENTTAVAPEKSNIVKANEISNETYGKLFAVNASTEEGKFKIAIME